MKLKTLICSLACALGAGVTTSSMASSYGFTNVGDITGALTTGDMEFYANGLQSVMPGSFTYDFFFQVNIPYFGLGVVADLPSIGPRYNIDGMSVALWSDDGVIAVADAPDMLVINYGTGDYITGSGQLNAGEYFFRITGLATGTQGGQFSYSASAVPVPEAETWAMMAAGLGLVGMQLRRRTRRGHSSIVAG